MKATVAKTINERIEEARKNVERLEAVSTVLEEVQRHKDYCRTHVRDEETGELIMNEDGSGYLKRDPEEGEWNYMEFRIWDMIEKYLLDC